MGYTHYFTNIQSSDGQWAIFIYAVEQLLENRSDISIKFRKLKINGVKDERLKINGVKDERGEDLIIDKNYKGGSFCKTGRKPYDIIVCAVLLLYQHILGNSVNLSSDGEIDEDEGWLDAKELYQNLPIVKYIQPKL